VLVGVDVYERPDVPRLSGCVNDVALVRRVLKDYFEVPNEDIRVVVNERATKDFIMHRLRATIAEAEHGDVVVFYFSGHGSQIRDRNGDELLDHMDEVLCPYDMDWDRGTYILDDDLDGLFAEARSDILLEAFFDCCFWGAGPRELDSDLRPQALRTDVRYLPPPFDIASRAEGDEDSLHVHRLSHGDCFTENNVVWAASAEGQISAEDYLDGRAHGVFTYWGCRFIEANIDRLLVAGYSREQLLEDVRDYLQSLGYPQSPELGAPLDLREVGPFRRAGEASTRAGRGRPRPWTRRAPSAGD